MWPIARWPAARWGLAVAVIGLLSAGLVHVVWPTPDESWALRDEALATQRITIGPQGVVAAIVEPLAYDAANDSTLVAIHLCSHAVCGPYLWVDGHVGRADGARVIYGEGVFELARRDPAGPGETPYDRPGLAMADASRPVRVEAQPPAVPLRAAAFAVAAAGLVLATARAPLAGAWALLPVVVSIGMARAIDLSLILAQVVGVPLLGIASVSALVLLVWKGPTPARVAVTLLLPLFLAQLSYTMTWRPTPGWGD